MRLWRRASTLLVSLGAAALGLQAAPAGVHPGDRTPGDRPVRRRCVPSDTVHLPGAEASVKACLPDVTTAGLLQAPVGEFTDRTDRIPLHVPRTSYPSGVPGLRVDGYFPDTSTFNTTHGWNHDGQFVLRIPDAWNGRTRLAPRSCHRPTRPTVVLASVVIARLGRRKTPQSQ